MSTNSELQAKYYAAVERCKVADQAEAAAKIVMDEKRAFVWKTPEGTIEDYLTTAENWNEEVAFVEKIERRYAAEYERDLCYADWMKYKHGADSKEAQIAQHRAELARTMEFVHVNGSPYWIKWDNLDNKAWGLYYQLIAEGYDNYADELDMSRDVFCERIEEEYNGHAFRNARIAAVRALNKWEQGNDRAGWNKAQRRYSAELAKWNAFKPKGEQYAKELEETINFYIDSLAALSEFLSGHIDKGVAELQEEAKQDPHSSRGLELLKKYDAAVKIYQAAYQTVETATKERDVKRALADGTQDGTKERYLAWAEYWKADIVLLEKVEQRHAAAFRRDLCYAEYVKHEHGADSKEAQIAQQRAEVARTVDFVHVNGSPYWTKWRKLYSKAWCVWNQLKEEGYDNIADELDSVRKVFCSRIKEESNGKAFRNARYLAFAALNKWEEEDDRVAWDKAKPKYDYALAKWNEFKPKGEQYAEELEETISKCSKQYLTGYGVGNNCDISALKDELSRNNQTIDGLEDALDQKDQEIALLRDELGQRAHEITALKDELHGRTSELEARVEEMRTRMQSLIHMNEALINGQYQQLEEFEAFARTTLQQEWQNWLERATSSHAYLVNWIQERIAKMAALEEEEATARKKYKHEFYDSVQNIDNRRFALKVMLSGSIFD